MLELFWIVILPLTLIFSKVSNGYSLKFISPWILLGKLFQSILSGWYKRSNSKEEPL
jgi:hypothetical protein